MEHAKTAVNKEARPSTFKEMDYKEGNPKIFLDSHLSNVFSSIDAQPKGRGRGRRFLQACT
jgi:hypothetical protein